MVVEDGVDTGVARLRVVPLVARLAGRRTSMPVALCAAHVAPASAIRNVPEFLHIDVYKRSGIRVLVAADRLAGGPVGVRKPIEAPW